MLDRQIMDWMLTGAEHRINSYGWEEPPSLSMLLNEPDAQMLEFTTTAIEFEKPAGLYLVYLAEKFTKDPSIAQTMIAKFPHVVGLAFHQQSWANDEVTGEFAPDQQDASADVPGSYEVRDLSMVDCWGRFFHTRRARGKDPVVSTARPVGRVPIALTQLMITLSPHLSRGSTVLLSQTLINMIGRES